MLETHKILSHIVFKFDSPSSYNSRDPAVHTDKHFLYLNLSTFCSLNFDLLLFNFFSLNPPMTHQLKLILKSCSSTWDITNSKLTLLHPPLPQSVCLTSIFVPKREKPHIMYFASLSLCLTHSVCFQFSTFCFTHLHFGWRGGREVGAAALLLYQLYLWQVDFYLVHKPQGFA